MSAVPTYEPKPGTVAFRAVTWLESQPHGIEVMTSKLAEMIGVAPTILQASLAAAVTHRAIFCRKKVDALRAPMFWSLVDHGAAVSHAKPETAAAHGVANHTPIVQACRAEDRAMLATPAGAELVGKVVQSLTMADVAERAPSACAQAKEHAERTPSVRIALWSDKRLQIGETLYTVEETRAIVDYLDAIAREVVA